MEESRVKKSLLNARVNLIFYVLILLISFFSRKIFLNCLGADFVGLTGTLMSLLNFLNLAELGISTAIGYVLYKPIFEHDETRINEIISVLVSCRLFFLPQVFPMESSILLIIPFWPLP